MTHDFITLNYSPQEINEAYLHRSFDWDSTEEGREYWHRQYLNGLSDEARAKWIDMQDAYYESVLGISNDCESLYTYYPISTDEVFARLFKDNGVWYKVDHDFDVYKIAVDSRAAIVKYEPPGRFGPKDKINYGHFQDYAPKLRSDIYSAGNMVETLACSILSVGGRIRDIEGKTVWSGYFKNVLHKIYNVSEHETDKDFVEIYKTHKDFLRCRKTPVKVGRAIRWMFPHITDADLELIVKHYKDLTADRVFTLHTGSKRQDFKHAYGDDLTKSRNPSTSTSRKSLHNSCMRGVIVGNGTSPAEVYASGDFHIAWLECEDKKIAGRVVVRNATDSKPPQAGPVYGVCEQSLDMLEKYVDSIGAVRYDNNSSWIGAKVLYMEVHGSIVGPYSDMESDLEQDGKYLVFSRHGTVEFTSTSGYANDEYVEFCECCGDRFHTEHEGCHVDGHGWHCDICLQENFVFLESEYEYVHVDDTVEVHSYRSGRKYSERRHKYDDDTVWCECVDEFWDYDYVTHSEKYGEYVPTHLVGDYPEMFEEEEEAA